MCESFGGTRRLPQAYRCAVGGGGSQCSKVPLSRFDEAASSQNLQPTWEGTRDVICADILGTPPCNKVEEVLGHRGVAPEGG